MELEALKKPNQPKKLTEKQEQLYKLLKQHLNIEPATFFSDACKIMNDESGLEAKTNLVSHLLREIIGEITNKLLPPDFREKIAKTIPLAEKNFSVGATSGYQVKVVDNNPTYRDKIDFIVAQFEVNSSDENVQFWKEVLADKQQGLHKFAHRSNVQGIRKIDASFQERWEQVQSLLFFQLELIKNKIIEDYKVLDAYLGKSNLSEKDIVALKEHVPLNSFTLQYFFGKSTHYNNIKKLREKGFFDYPTPPKEHDSGGFSFPLWPQVQFLSGAASNPNLQEEVLNICLEVETENYNVQHPIVELVAKLLPKISILFKDVAQKWLDSQHYWVDHRPYGDLMIQYARNRYCKEVSELTKSLLRVKPNPRPAVEVEGYKIGHEPVSIIDEHHYEEFLNEYIPKIAEFCGVEIIEPLLSSLYDYISIQNEHRNYSKDDYSDMWRPSIEKSPKHGLSNFLISAIRDLAVSHLKENPKDLPLLLKALDAYKLSTSRRIKAYLLSLAHLDVTKAEHRKMLTDILLEPNEFGQRADFTYEYFILAQKYADVLTNPQKEKILKWIATPPETDQKGFREYWQAAHLKPFIQFGERWKKLYEEAVSVSGEPKYRSEESHVYMREVKDNSPMTIELLKKKSPEEVIDYARNWKPKDNDPLERTLDGLGIAIATLLQEDPQKWLVVIEKIPSLDKTYVRSYFDGFVKARKAGKVFDWTKLLEVAEKVLIEHPASKDNKDTGSIGFDPNWSWCRRTIADLVSDGLNDNDNQIPQKNRKQVWKVIELLLKDPSPDEKKEKSIEDQHRDKDRDYLTIAINSIRGIAMQATIEYGIWIKLKLTEDKQKIWKIDKEAPELSEALLSHLDVKKDSSPAIRSVYGQQLMRLTWLDEKWMTKNKNAIFPTKKIEQEYFDAAWESYVCYVDPRKQMLDIYKDEYERAIHELGTRADSHHHLVSPDQRLVQHLSLLYIWGFLDFSSDKNLWDIFYDSAPVEARAEVINFIGRSLQDWTKIKPETRSRLQKLIETRLETIKSLDDPKFQAGEFQSFGHWFESHIFPTEWKFRILLEAQKLGCKFEGVHMIIEELENTIADYPLESAAACKYVTDNDKEGWEIISWRENLYGILEKIVKSENKDAKAIGIEAIKNLVANGYTDFKNIVDNTANSKKGSK